MNYFMLEDLPVPRWKVEQLYNGIYDWRQSLYDFEVYVFNLSESGYLSKRYKDRYDRAVSMSTNATTGLAYYLRNNVDVPVAAYNTANTIWNDAKSEARGIRGAIDDAKRRAAADENPIQRGVKDTIQTGKDAVEAAGEAVSGAGEAVSDILSSPAAMGAALAVLVLVVVMIK